MSIIMLTFELFVIIFLYSGTILFFHQSPQVEKESGAEGEEEIGDSQELLYSGSLLFFHQVPQVEKESGAEGEEEIGDSQETLTSILWSE